MFCPKGFRHSGSALFTWCGIQDVLPPALSNGSDVASKEPCLQLFTRTACSEFKTCQPPRSRFKTRWKFLAFSPCCASVGWWDWFVSSRPGNMSTLFTNQKRSTSSTTWWRANCCELVHNASEKIRLVHVFSAVTARPSDWSSWVSCDLWQLKAIRNFWIYWIYIYIYWIYIGYIRSMLYASTT